MTAEKVFKTGIILLMITLVCTVAIVRAPDIEVVNPADTLMENDVASLVANVSTFFIYNVTEDSINLTDDDLMARGGDCKDWSEYYIRHLKQYNATSIQVNVSENVAHRFVIVSNSVGYCLIDQTNYYCNTYKR